METRITGRFGLALSRADGGVFVVAFVYRWPQAHTRRLATGHGRHTVGVRGGFRGHGIVWF